MSGELIGPLGDLERAEAITPTSLRLPADLDYEQAEMIGRYLGAFRDATAWWLGDYIIQTEELFGERSYQLSEATGRSPETLKVFAWVARAIPPARRRDGLSFSHHQTVAKHEPPEQKRLLDLAERERLSVHELRGRLGVQPGELTSGRSRHEQIEEAAVKVWLGSSLNVTKDGYVTPVEVMQSLGRLLDGEQP
jgi:hypothetical protein